MLFFKKKQNTLGEVPTEKKNKGAIKEIIAKLSRGLMLPIAMLPIAGLFLGIGATISNQAVEANNKTLEIFGNIFQMPGNIVFSCLPVLFAIAIAITFTKESGTAGLSAFIGWICMNALQTAFIYTTTNQDASLTYHFLFYDFDATKYSAIFTSNAGIPSLSTSVFGGIIIGFVVAWLYNRFKDIQLPKVIGFFSGVRFIPIVTFFAAVVLGFTFSLVWPMIGIGLYNLGGILSNAPFGINSLVFGIAERSLVPFGLHHAFYAPLWYTSAGGQFNLASAVYYNGVQLTAYQNWSDVFTLNGRAVPTTTVVQGDQPLWMFVNSQLCGLNVQLNNGSSVVVTLSNYKDFTSAVSSTNLLTGNPGQYMQGKYSFMMFGLPAAAVAMIVVVPKGENRKQAFSIIVSAALTSFLTGITEPLEFTFLFLAPWLFWGIHAPLAGVSFWLMNLFGAHMGMTFSGGALDFVIYGVIPDATNHAANCYWAVVIGAAFIPVYFFLFLFLIKKFDIKTPGRGEAIKLFSKQDYKNKNSGSAEETNVKVDKYSALADEVIKAYGGYDNIKNVDACITKLRIQVADQSKVDHQQLVKLGAAGVIKPSKQSVYAVFGNEADILKNRINEKIKNRNTEKPKNKKA